jgi:hypothetical protein
VFGNQVWTDAQIQFLGHLCAASLCCGKGGSPLGRQAQVKLGNRARTQELTETHFQKQDKEAKQVLNTEKLFYCS